MDEVRPLEISHTRHTIKGDKTWTTPVRYRPRKIRNKFTGKAAEEFEKRNPETDLIRRKNV
jgi:hypothetical protein